LTPARIHTLSAARARNTPPAPALPCSADTVTTSVARMIVSARSSSALMLGQDSSAGLSAVSIRLRSMPFDQ
jgi:hypothetical protein